jgi:hypothetical protein
VDTIYSGQYDSHRARTCASPTLTRALPVGSTDHPHLRGVPAAVPAVLCPLYDAHCAMPDANSTAFMTHSVEIRQIQGHIGVDSEPPILLPVSGPPLWDGCEADAQRRETAQAGPD